MAALYVALFLLAGLGKAVADATAHGSSRLSKLSPWFTAESWRLKYRNGDHAQGPRFFGSTTVFVAVTDGWHFANAVTGVCLDAAWLLATWPTLHWYAVAAVLARRVAFQPAYAFLRK